jgi:ketosteroid isomerase-like protein
MANLTDHKRTAQRLFECFSASDLDGVFALMTDDVTWHITGKPELLPSARTYDRRSLRRLFERMLERLETGLRMTMLDAIAEGDRVAAEVESSGDLKNGRKYRQQYHFAIRFRDGKISAVREYLDTQHVYEVWHRE